MRARHRGGSSATAHAGLSAECARGPARPGEDEVPARVVLRVSIPTSRGPTVETCSFTSIRGFVKMQRLERLEKMETSRRGKKRENVPQGTFRRRKSFLRTFLYQPKFATNLTLIFLNNTPVGREVADQENHGNRVQLSVIKKIAAFALVRSACSARAAPCAVGRV